MTRPKKAEHPSCKVSLTPSKGGGMFVEIDWIDRGKERISARITKALKREGHQARAGALRFCAALHEGHSFGGEGHRHCIILTPAPFEVVESVAARYFLKVEVDRTVHPDTEPIGDASALISLEPQ